MKGSTNKKPNIKDKIKGKAQKRELHFNKAIPDVPKGGVETLPTLSNLQSISKEERAAYANKTLKDMLQFLPNYIVKKQGSRVVQQLIKWADQKFKNLAFETLKPHWKQMVRDKYSVFVLKLLVRNVNIPELVENCDTLQGIYEAAVVLDTFIKHTATGDQIQAIKKHFLELIASPDQKKQQVIDNIVVKAVEQNYYHLTMSKFIFRYAIHNLVEIERQKVLECLRPNIISLIYDIEGVKLFFEVYNYSNTKQRKDMVKLIKQEIENIISSGNSNAYMAVLKLLHSTDDTVLLQKSIIKDLAPYFNTIYDDRRIFNIVFSVFSPLNHNNNIMHKWQPKIKYTTNKKDNEQRISQVRAYMINQVIEAIKQKPLSEIISHEHMSKLIVSIIAYTSVDNDIPEHNEWIKEIAELFVNDTKKLIEKDDKTFTETSLVCHNNAHRVLKYLITINQRVSQGVSAAIDNAISKILTFFLKHLNKVLKSKSSYILISIMENTGNKDLILDTIKKSKINLKDVVGGQIYEKS